MYKLEWKMFPCSPLIEVYFSILFSTVVSCVVTTSNSTSLKKSCKTKHTSQRRRTKKIFRRYTKNLNFQQGSQISLPSIVRVQPLVYANQYSFKPSEKREASEPLRLRYLCFCRDHLAKKKRSPKRSKYIPVFHAHTRPKTEVLLFKTLPSLALAFLTRPHGVKLQFSVRPFDYIRSLSTLL